MKDPSLPGPLQKAAELPDCSPVVDLIEAFRRSKAMFAAVSLGVFDHLERQPAAANQLAEKIQLSPESLERLLDACVGLQLLRRNGALYENEPISSVYLCRDGEYSLSGYVLYSNEVLFRLWRRLEDAVREGTPRWEQEFGSRDAIFEHFFRTREAKQDFLKGMHGFGMLSSPKVAAAFDLSRYRKLVDLGGATGHLAMAACERYPELKATVFDLPDVIEATRDYRKKSELFSRRIDVARGNFFRDELPAGDLFALGRILHDWGEDKIHSLLTRIFQRLPANGGILIAEKILREDKTGPASALLQSLNMLVCTEGKERTLNEYRQLLENAGFEGVSGVTTGAYLDAILATKPS